MHRLLCFLTLTLFCESHEQKVFRAPEQTNGVIGFNWSAVVPTPKLKYTACYDGFECARLEVPLDWNNLSNPNKVQLAVIRLPATVPETDPTFGGTILFNPGGPGGSGIDVMRWTGNGIREVVDGEKHFEILSWDPRGIQHTTPSVSCFDSDFQRNVWTYRFDTLGSMEASNTSLHHKWALGQSFGKLCEKSKIGLYDDGSHMAQYSTTALVARDMVEIIDRVQDLRTEVLRSAAELNGASVLYPEEPALLNFWGYSYGSYLGNTFATMFTSRIGRMILDSVIDTYDYTTTSWLGNLADNNKTLDFFYRDCFEAGHLCALHNEDVKSPNDIAQRIEELLDHLKSRPIPVLADDAPQIITFSDVSSFIFTTMYFPTWAWPELAQTLADLLRGNGTSMARHLPKLEAPGRKLHVDILGEQLVKGINKTVPGPPGYPFIGEASRATMCGDGDDITHLTTNDWRERLKTLQKSSPIAGWRWSEAPLICVFWPKSFRPSDRNRFQGPWKSKLTDYDLRASPLLFIGGTGDPVLPLKNAYKAAAGHEGARVLIQDAPGHCTGYINPARCTWGHIKTFFAEGVLPENNTICPRDGTAWVKY